MNRVDHLVRWPAGIARVLLHRLPGGPTLHRTQSRGDARDLPLPVPPGVRDDRLQLVTDGVGELLHRRYSTVIDGADRSPEDLMTAMRAEPNCVVPDAAVFQRRAGDGAMQLCDEYAIRMPAPWDGPVRVIDLTPRSFRFGTLWGHLEAGQIEFRADTLPDGALRFEIESWARPGDRLAHLLYNRLPLAKEVQLTVWARTCTAVAGLVGGTARGGVAVDTRVVRERFLVEPPPGT